MGRLSIEGREKDLAFVVDALGVEHAFSRMALERLLMEHGEASEAPADISGIPVRVATEPKPSVTVLVLADSTKPDQRARFRAGTE